MSRNELQEAISKQNKKSFLHIKNKITSQTEHLRFLMTTTYGLKPNPKTLRAYLYPQAEA